jgi:phosphatidylinositol glycan class P protein
MARRAAGGSLAAAQQPSSAAVTAAAAAPTNGGASSVEVYGFVGWVASALGLAAYLLWAFLPDAALRALGVTYYPSK